MKLRTLVLGGLAGAAALAFASPASAYIACNREGDCWHVENRYTQPGMTFEYHPDDWYFHRSWRDNRWERNRYRDWREGRGYWRNGAWVTF